MKKTSKLNQNAWFKPRKARSGLLKLIVLGGFVLSTGCTSLVNIGASEFNCPSPDGVQCKSSREIYEMTHEGAVPEPVTTKKGKRSAGSKQEQAERVTANDKSEVNEQKEIANKDPVIDNYVAPRLPDRPVPIRTPAHVMRIWVAPWENTSGDLITTGYVYTEIEPRRWVIGNAETNSNPVLRPLQSVEKNQP